MHTRGDDQETHRHRGESIFHVTNPVVWRRQGLRTRDGNTYSRLHTATWVDNVTFGIRTFLE